MMKTIVSGRMTAKLAAFVAVSLLTISPALAQSTGSTSQVTAGATAPADAPPKAIGAAPAHSRQNKILAKALSPETRQTLQEAMDSYADDGK
jgi:hypothetical protein